MGFYWGFWGVLELETDLDFPPPAFLFPTPFIFPISILVGWAGWAGWQSLSYSADCSVKGGEGKAAAAKEKGKEKEKKKKKKEKKKKKMSRGERVENDKKKRHCRFLCI